MSFRILLVQEGSETLNVADQQSKRNRAFESFDAIVRPDIKAMSLKRIDC